MSEQPRRRRWRAPTEREIAQAIDFVVAVIMLDMLTGSHLRMLAARYAAWAQRSWAPTDPLSASDKANLQEEARRITKEASG